MEQITLHQPLARPWGMPNLSPFCTKLETYLRMADVPHKLGPMKMGQMPKGKIPYVHMDGRFMGDSQLIIEELEKRLGDAALDAGLSARDAAIGRLTRRMLEEATYFINILVRWRLDDGWEAMRAQLREHVPALVLPIIRRGQKKKLHLQGIGRHTADEAMAMGAADFAAVAEVLGDKPFILGDKPRTVDCTVFAFAESILAFPVDSPLKASVATHKNLAAYRQRIRDRWFKDLSAPA